MTAIELKFKQSCFKKNHALEEYILMWGNALISNSIYVLMITCMCVREEEREEKGRQRKKEEWYTKMGLLAIFG